jgi:hypothetical protein
MEPAPPVQQLEPNVPDAVARLIDRALSFSPEHRFASAAEMRQSLVSAYRLTTGQPLGAKRPTDDVVAADYTPTLRVTTGTTVITHRSNAPARMGWIDRWDAAAMATAFFALGGIVVGSFATGHGSADGAIEETVSLVTPAAPAASSALPIGPVPEAISANLEPPSTSVEAPLPRVTCASAEPATSRQAPILRSPAAALPPPLLPGSVWKRPPRPAAAGDHFDFIETRR